MIPECVADEEFQNQTISNDELFSDILEIINASTYSLEDIVLDDLNITEDISLLNDLEKPNAPLDPEVNAEVENFQNVSVICKQKGSHEGKVRIPRLRHTVKKIMYTCQLCNKEFVWESKLRRHLRVHTSETYKCETCGKQFSQKNCLIVHIKIHMGIKTDMCIICGKQFAQKRNLRKHKKTHTDGKSYTCHTCGKQFALESYLKRHVIRNHTRRT